MHCVSLCLAADHDDEGRTAQLTWSPRRWPRAGAAPALPQWRARTWYAPSIVSPSPPTAPASARPTGRPRAPACGTTPSASATASSSPGTNRMALHPPGKSPAPPRTGSFRQPPGARKYAPTPREHRETPSTTDTLRSCTMWPCRNSTRRRPKTHSCACVCAWARTGHPLPQAEDPRRPHIPPGRAGTSPRRTPAVRTRTRQLPVGDAHTDRPPTHPHATSHAPAWPQATRPSACSATGPASSTRHPEKT